MSESVDTEAREAVVAYGEALLRLSARVDELEREVERVRADAEAVAVMVTSERGERR